MVFGDYPRVMGTAQSGPGTATGEGNIIYDNRGNYYRVVDRWEADAIHNSTGGHVYTWHPDGSIR